MARKKAAEQDLLSVLEKAVRDVLKSTDSKPSERLGAIQAGAKIAMIKAKLSDSDEKNFFNT